MFFYGILFVVMLVFVIYIIFSDFSCHYFPINNTEAYNDVVIIFIDRNTCKLNVL
jgi:hypothetical protein